LFLSIQKQKKQKKASSFRAVGRVSLFSSKRKALQRKSRFSVKKSTCSRWRGARREETAAWPIRLIVKGSASNTYFLEIKIWKKKRKRSGKSSSSPRESPSFVAGHFPYQEGGREKASRSLHPSKFGAKKRKKMAIFGARGGPVCVTHLRLGTTRSHSKKKGRQGKPFAFYFPKEEGRENAGISSAFSLGFLRKVEGEKKKKGKTVLRC